MNPWHEDVITECAVCDRELRLWVGTPGAAAALFGGPSFCGDLCREIYNESEDSETMSNAKRAQSLESLAMHILAMADDAFLCDHPEWHEIVAEARAIPVSAENQL